ncbi:hypothetical protein [Aquibacillus kalidii]|uniref:hypothetical protein n=1 Tax=Aquibacillus kalidii TaxID=2762597 RepID=UPI001C99FCD5|nr:hypothetical protein [Aquibacillus kalidii]
MHKTMYILALLDIGDIEHKHPLIEQHYKLETIKILQTNANIITPNEIAPQPVSLVVFSSPFFIFLANETQLTNKIIAAIGVANIRKSNYFTPIKFFLLNITAS